MKHNEAMAMELKQTVEPGDGQQLSHAIWDYLDVRVLFGLFGDKIKN